MRIGPYEQEEECKATELVQSATEKIDINLVPGALENRWCQKDEDHLQTYPEISIVIEQLSGLKLLRKLPFFRTAQQLICNQEITLPITLSTIEKKIINGVYYRNYEELCQDLRTFVDYLRLHINDETGEKEAGKKLEEVLALLRERRLNIQRLDCVYNESKGKRGSRISKRI
jgi:hypothetical protein